MTNLATTQADNIRKFLITADGLQKLKEELAYLIDVRRKEVIERIREAASHGDLSENADYAQAREEQSFVEGRIQEIEDIIRNSEIITHVAGGIVSVGSTIQVKVSGKVKTYTIVGSSEANPTKGLISNESTVGKALLGKKAGDKVKVATPAGSVTYEILTVE